MTEQEPEIELTADQKWRLNVIAHVRPYRSDEDRTAALVAAVEKIVAEHLAPVMALARDLAAWDLVDMAVPESVDVPDDYELAMNDAGAQLHAALRYRSGQEGS